MKLLVTQNASIREIKAIVTAAFLCNAKADYLKMSTMADEMNLQQSKNKWVTVRLTWIAENLDNRQNWQHPA